MVKSILHTDSTRYPFSHYKVNIEPAKGTCLLA